MYTIDRTAVEWRAPMSSGEQIAPGATLDAETRVSGEGSKATSGVQVPASDMRPGGVDPGVGATMASSRAQGSGVASDEARLTIGSRIDRYVVLGRLGEGGMGEVFSGYDEELDRRVALKLTRSQVLGESERRERMRREAQALASLSHPNVVQVYDVGEFHGQLFIAMEHVKGETLADWQSRLDPRLPAERQAILDMYGQAGRGLAAAHSVGIVHRDFKPANVLVGVDGRARVLDFGLADRSDAASGAATWARTAFAGDRGSELTATGSIMGTPAYMAPEQFRGARSDERTDIFAFSIALHEALLGESPFFGDTLESRRDAVLAGRVREVRSSGIPEWLRAVLARGFAAAPADRFPRMEAMLAALADDPIARRRRRWRQFGLAVAAISVGAALLLVALWGWERLQERRAERLASERLVAVERRIAELVDGGAVDEAERVFLAFADHPDNRGREALAGAWLRRAERAGARADAAQAVDALAAAYTVAIRPEDQTAAIVGLARRFRDEMQWDGLLRALATLEARDGASEPRDIDDIDDVDNIDDIAELRLDAALARRDLAGAVALLRGPLRASALANALAVVEALRPASPTVHHHRGFARVVDIDGDGRPEIALETNDRARGLAPLLRAEPTLPMVAAVDLGKENFRAIAGGPGERALLVASDGRAVDGAEADAVVSWWQDGALVEVLRWPEGQILSALGADIDGDGVFERLVGAGPYTRRLIELVQEPGGGWSTRSPAPAIDSRRSDVVDLLAEDLDGDGQVEVVAVLGPWTAYELQVLRHDPGSDTLETVTRRRLGNMSGAALVRGGVGGPEIVVSKTDDYPSTVVFPRSRPYGEPAGTYMFKMVDDALVQTAFVPAPVLAGGARVLDERPLVGDLDGDGRDEVILCRAIAGAFSSITRDVTVILVRGATDSLTPLVLADMRPLAALDLDGDGDDELIVSIPEEDDRVWVLGSGSAALPMRPPATESVAVRPLPRDPALARMWRHADDLLAMGLLRQAAESLAKIADLVAEPELRARAEQEAAELHEALEDDARAAPLFARAASEPALARGAHEGAARASLRLARLDAANVHVQAMTAESGESGEQRQALAAEVAALRGAPLVDHDFKGPLAPDWQVHQPLALRRYGARGVLHVDAPVPGEVLSAPIRWSGQSLMLEVDIALAQVEWRAGLEIGLVHGEAGVRDAASPLGVEITTIGGGTDRVHEIGCVIHGRRTAARIPFVVGDPGQKLGRFKIRVTLLPGVGEWVCAVERVSGESVLYRRGRLAGERVEGPLRLTIAARGPKAWLEADLHGLRLTGASPGDAQARPRSDAEQVEAGRRLVEGDDLGVLEVLDSRSPASTMGATQSLRFVGLARLGRWREAERVLAAVLADPGLAAAHRASLMALLRSEPKVYGPLVRGAAGPAVLRAELAAAWWVAVIVDRDPGACEVVWAGLADLDLDGDRYEILKVHAAAAASLGHRAAAAASYRAGLRALADPVRLGGVLSAGHVPHERAQIHLELAALALAAGDEAAARRELTPLLADPATALFVADSLHAREDLRALWSLAPE